MKTVTVQRDIRAEHQAAAEHFRQRATNKGMLIVRLLSSPGAGKTSLLEATARTIGDDRSLAVLVGDVETDRDAQRLTPLAPTVQITTGGACHLEIPLVERAFRQLPSEKIDLLFIEDVGNLICPASHDLGEHIRVVLLSTTEGDDKPGKYPKMFRTSQAVVITKTDLLPYVPFSIDDAAEDARQIQPDLAVMPLSIVSSEGVDAWCGFLDSRWRSLRQMQRAEPTPA